MTTRLLRNSVTVLSGQTVGKVCALATSILIARHFSVSDVGRLSYALALAAFLGLWTEFGLSTVLSREVANGEHSLGELVGGALAVKFLNYLLGAAVMAVWAFAAPNLTTRLVLVLLAVAAILFDSVTQTLTAVSSGLERFRPVTFAALAVDACRLAGVLIVLIGGFSILAVGAAYLATSIIICAGMVLWVGHTIHWRAIVPRIDSAPKMYRLAAAFVIYGILLQIYFRVDTLMLGWMQTDLQVGLYAAAYRLLEASLFVPAALMGVLLPHFSRNQQQDPARNPELLRRIVQVMFTAVMPVVIIVSALGTPLMRLLYGEKFAPSGPTLSILIWTLALICVNAVFPMYLNAMRRERTTIRIFLIAATFNVTLNLVLIPRMGAMGAAISTVLTEVLNTSLYVTAVRRVVGSIGLRGLLLRMGTVTVSVLTVGSILWTYGPLLTLTCTLTAFLAMSIGLKLVDRGTILALAPAFGSR